MILHFLVQNVNDIYNQKEYKKSQEYKKENFKFNLIASTFSFIILIIVLYNGKILLSGTTKDLIEDEEAKKLYLGTKFKMDY